MAQGFSGGFFLPAQRSVHCKGGFFASATKAPPASSQRQTFPVLFTLPNATGNQAAAATATTDAKAADPKPKPSYRRVYDPEEGDEDTEALRSGSDDRTPSIPERATPPSIQRSASTSGLARSRQSNRVVRVQAAVKSTAKTASSKAIAGQQAIVKQESGDIHAKFEIAMHELNQIKDEFDLKQQRQNSTPALPISRHSGPPPSVETNQSAQPQLPETNHSTPPSEPPVRDLQSPRQRLQVAEMVMRKLYKKNLQTEQALAAAIAERDALAKSLAQQSTTSNNNPHSNSTTCLRCQQTPPLLSPLSTPPSIETIAKIDQQQLEYLRHLATEQDRTIASLKLRIEELSGQLLAVRRQPKTNSSKTPRQVVTKLQSKLQDALQESARQRTNYVQLKRDFQRLLSLKTKTLTDNPAQLSTSARELVALMEKQLATLEAEHSRNLSAYNNKLYETEQQSCESYAQQRLIQEELERVASDVQQRDALDVEIEQCMASVFERLHHVERENMALKHQQTSLESQQVGGYGGATVSTRSSR